MHRKKALALIELISAATLAALIGVAAMEIFYIQTLFTKEIASKSKRSQEAQYALEHLLSNIYSSAYITTDKQGFDTGTIILHSHSSPNLRSYTFADNQLTYKEGDNDAVILARNMNSLKAYSPEDGTPYAFTPFKPVWPFTRDEKDSDGMVTKIRTNAITIEFWTKSISSSDDEPPSPERDGFYCKVEARCQEDWDMMYLDPDRADASFQDGTKSFPFLTIQDAIDSISELPANPEVVQKIVVSSGEHTLSESVTIKPSLVVFGPNSTLTVNPGTQLYLGDARSSPAVPTKIFVRGNFSLAGGEAIQDKIKITSIYNFESPTNEQSWSICLASPQENYELKNLFLYDGGSLGGSAMGGIAINQYNFKRKVVDPFTVIFADNDVRNTVVRIAGAQELDVSRNYFNSMHGIAVLNDGAADGTISHIIVNNTLEGGAIIIDADAESTQFITQEISGNNITKAGYYYDGHGITYWPKGEGAVQARIYNNTISGFVAPSSSWISRAGISLHGGYHDNTNSSSYMLIDNNIIDGTRGATNGIGSYYTSVPVYIRNNLITNTTNTYNVSAGVSGSGAITGYSFTRDIFIENNLFHGNAGYDINMLNGQAPNVTVQNNVCYGGGISIANYNVNFIFNTITNGTVRGSGEWSIKNSIIWGSASLNSLLYPYVTYSDVLNGSGDYLLEEKHNIVPPEDPLFVNQASHDYRLQAASPCKTAGEHDGLTNIEIGAYGPDGNAVIGVQ